MSCARSLLSGQVCRPQYGLKGLRVHSSRFGLGQKATSTSLAVVGAVCERSSPLIARTDGGTLQCKVSNQAGPCSCGCSTAELIRWMHAAVHRGTHTVLMYECAGSGTRLAEPAEWPRNPPLIRFRSAPLLRLVGFSRTLVCRVPKSYV